MIIDQTISPNQAAWCLRVYLGLKSIMEDAGASNFVSGYLIELSRKYQHIGEHAGALIDKLNTNTLTPDDLVKCVRPLSHDDLDDKYSEVNEFKDALLRLANVGLSR